jgi:hypothetical protein
MVMTQQGMRLLMDELQKCLKRLGCLALFDELTKLERSPDAICELLDLAKRAEAASDKQ